MHDSVYTMQILITDLEYLRFVGILVENLSQLNDKWRQNQTLVEIFFRCNTTAQVDIK